VIVRRIGDETLVYDRASDRAHCLDRAASLVFVRCDGATSREGLARTLAKDLGLTGSVESGLVALAVARLGEAGLLEDVPGKVAAPRRAALRALAAASLLPMVLSVVAPSPAEAQTCIPRGGQCNSSSQCCPDAPCCRQLGQRPPQCRPGGGNCIP
jgi:hypothetical protein